MDDALLHDVAIKHHNVLKLANASALGLTAEALAAHARRNNWPRPAPGVVLPPGTQLDYLGGLRVGLAACKGRPVVSREAAAYVHGLLADPPEQVELMVEANRHDSELEGLEVPVYEQGQQRTLRFATWRSRTLSDEHRIRRQDVAVTRASRTVFDLASIWPIEDLRLLAIDARQRKQLRLGQLDALLSAHPRFPGRGSLRQIVEDLHEETCDSALELLFRREARKRGFHPHPHPFPFRCSDGIVIAIDVAFPWAWVACECDGLGSHAERADLQRDHVRQNKAVTDGWAPFRIDWARLSKDPGGLFAELSTLLANADRSRAPAPEAPRAEVDRRFRGRRR